jgi:hypothetical protein
MIQKHFIFTTLITSLVCLSEASVGEPVRLESANIADCGQSHDAGEDDPRSAEIRLIGGRPISVGSPLDDNQFYPQYRPFVNACNREVALAKVYGRPVIVDQKDDWSKSAKADLSPDQSRTFLKVEPGKIDCADSYDFSPHWQNVPVISFDGTPLIFSGNKSIETMCEDMKRRAEAERRLLTIALTQPPTFGVGGPAKSNVDFGKPYYHSGAGTWCAGGDKRIDDDGSDNIEKAGKCYLRSPQTETIGAAR